MTDILDEVINDKNEERKVFLLKKALPIIGALTILAVIIMVIGNIRASSREKYKLETGDLLLTALENIQTDPKSAAEGIKYLMEDSKNHTRDIAALQMIAMNLYSKKFQDVLDLTTKIIQDSTYLDLTRDFAKLTWISIVVDGNATTQEKNTKQIKKYFDDFNNEDTPFYGSANLLQAIYYQNTDSEKAIKIAEKIISAKKVSPTIQDEARAVIANISAKTN